jgi:pantoate--beta-alanine ligase
MRSYSFETFNVCLDDESQPQLGRTLRLTQTQPTARRGRPEPERRLTAWRRRAGFDKVALPAARSEAAAFLIAPERVQMPRSPMIVRTVPALRRALDSLRLKRATIALVPTMGALHDGHVSLVRLAKRRATKVIVSIFVNPTQFAPSEDFGSYPRTWKADVAKLAAEKVDLIWNPDVKTMYPDGFATRISTEGPATAGLEDRFRPHFFGGVATVVGKLFTQCRPDFAIFGEKDFQQLRVVTRMALDLDLGVKVIGSRTVRERDGLAMSSRNVYLSPEERLMAPTLYRAMKESAKHLRAGEDIEAAIAGGAELITNAGFVLDYFEARHADSLAPVASVKDGPVRILVAAKLGKTRLIDNIGA